MVRGVQGTALSSRGRELGRKVFDCGKLGSWFGSAFGLRHRIGNNPETSLT